MTEPVRRWPLCLLLGVFGFLARGQPGPETILALHGAPVPLAPDLATRIDQYLAPFVAMNDFAGTFLVARRGRVLVERSYGLANRETGTPNSADVVFHIGSISKQFTAAGIMVLVDRHLVDLDAPVDRYLPGLANGGTITVRQVLTHSAGLGRDLPDKRTYSAVPHTAAELLAAARSVPPIGKPGSQFAYSNIDYLLLAEIIERVSGESYGAFLASALFIPLGMSHTGVDSTPLILEHRASGYQTSVGTDVQHAHFEDMSNELGYGALYSTAGDLLRWEEAWNRSPVLTPESWRAMFTDYGHQYGFGVSVRERAGHRVVGHDGNVPGFDGFLYRFVDDSVVAIMLSNVESGFLPLMEDELVPLLFADTAPRASLRPPAQRVPVATLRAYEGSYQVAPGFVLDVKEMGGDLYLRGGPGEWWFAMTPQSTTRFFYRHLFATITFAVRADGRVSGFTWKDTSGEYACKKIAS